MLALINRGKRESQVYQRKTKAMEPRRSPAVGGHIHRNSQYKKPKFKEMLHEKWDEATVLLRVERTQLNRREGPLLQPGQARR